MGPRWWVWGRDQHTACTEVCGSPRRLRRCLAAGSGCPCLQGHVAATIRDHPWFCPHSGGSSRGTNRAEGKAGLRKGVAGSCGIRPPNFPGPGCWWRSLDPHRTPTPHTLVLVWNRLLLRSAVLRSCFGEYQLLFTCHPFGCAFPGMTRCPLPGFPFIPWLFLCVFVTIPCVQRVALLSILDVRKTPAPYLRGLRSLSLVSHVKENLILFYTHPHFLRGDVSLSRLREESVGSRRSRTWPRHCLRFIM